MVTLADAAAGFLSSRRVAVVGVSREPGGQHGGNVIYTRMRERGYDVVAVNPHADTVEGDPCHPDLASIPGGVDAVVIATPADATPAVMAQCAELRIPQVWIHKALGPGSASPEAAAMGREAGLTVIEGGCPLMFEPCADGAHRFLRRMLRLTGKLPTAV